MAKLKSLEDLKRVREEAQQSIKTRTETGTTIVIGMGTCGIAAGARDIMDALLAEIGKAKVQDVIVTTSGCAGLCNAEPMMTVEIKNQPPVKYGHLTPEKLRKVFVQHILGGQMVADLVLGVGSETMY